MEPEQEDTRTAEDIMKEFMKDLMPHYKILMRMTSDMMKGIPYDPARYPETKSPPD